MKIKDENYNYNVLLNEYILLYYNLCKYTLNNIDNVGKHTFKYLIINLTHFCSVQIFLNVHTSNCIIHEF